MSRRERSPLQALPLHAICIIVGLSIVVPVLFVPSVSAGVAPSRTTVRSADIAAVSFTSRNVTERPPPAGTVIVCACATGVGPSISFTVTVAPVSPFSSDRSATTSIARVVSV